MPKSPINETSNKDTIAEPSNSAAPSATNAPASAYTVGYGRPPTRTRFRPGHSGNPKGRPKRPKEPIARAALEQKVALNDGDPNKASVRQAAFHNIAQRAASGDIKSVNFLLVHENEEQQRASQQFLVSPETALEIIRRYLERQKEPQRGQP
jgi:hypothetical protein